MPYNSWMGNGWLIRNVHEVPTASLLVLVSPYSHHSPFYRIHAAHFSIHVFSRIARYKVYFPVTALPRIKMNFNVPVFPHITRNNVDVPIPAWPRITRNKVHFHFLHYPALHDIRYTSLFPLFPLWHFYELTLFTPACDWWYYTVKIGDVWRV